MPYRVLSTLMWVTVTATLTTAGVDSNLAPAERRIVEYVASHTDEALALLERAVNINSGTMNPAGVREVAALFEAELVAIGFDTRWEDGSAFGRSGHLIAERRGRAPSDHRALRRFLLIGHLDTVFEPDSPFQRFERVSESEARGPGAADMKGGDVIIVQTLRALQAAGVLDEADFSVILTGDEERVGRPIEMAREALTALAKKSDIAIAFENGDNDARTAVVARRGATSWRIAARGTPAHSSQIFREDIGSGAIYELARILSEFQARMAGEKYLTFNPGLVFGGTTIEYDSMHSRGTAFGKSNVIAREAIATGDLRTVTHKQLALAKAKMQKIVSEHLPHTEAEIQFSDSYPPMDPSDGNRRLLEQLDRASRDLGLGPVEATDPMRAGAADIAFAARHVDMAIDGLGLLGDNEHTESETVDLRTLPTQTQRAALLIFRLMNPGGD